VEVTLVEVTLVEVTIVEITLPRLSDLMTSSISPCRGRERSQRGQALCAMI
jgi:hypothetical protein